jgi:ATP-binding cassette subfamily C protein
VFSMILGIWQLLTKRQKVVMGLLVFLRLVSNGLDIVALFLVATVVSLATGSGAGLPIVGSVVEFFEEPVVALLILTAIIFALKTTSGLILSRLTLIYLARVETAASMKVVQSVFGGGLARLRQFAKSELDWAVLRSTKVAFPIVLGGAVGLVAETTLAALIVGAFLITDWFLATLVVLYFSAILVGFQLIARANIIRSGRNFSTGTVSVGQALQDLAGAFREISVSGRKSFFIETIRESREKVSLADAKQDYFQAVPRLMTELGLIIGALSFFAVEYFRTNGEPDYVLLGIFFVGSLRIMSALLPIQRAFAAMRFNQGPAEAALMILTNISPQPADAGKGKVGTPLSSDSPPAIQANNLSFRYDESEDDSLALDGISLDIEPGSFTAIIGPSGGGKTTLIDIILSLYSPGSGQVLIDGLASSLYQKQNPEHVAYVPQKPGLVSGSIKSNVALGVPYNQVEDDRVWKALDEARLEDVVRGLPSGINSDLGKNTDSLSGGQMQRLGIARALYLNARLLILDEATSALDAETEDQISRILFNLRGKTTVVVVAHRLSTIKKADRIYVLDSGKQVAVGTFDQLRKSSDLVKRYIKLLSLDD